ncbi:metallophosphoesterase [Roseivivax marinus]|uniref:metallophosphoesterase n=1 Tax=Roseivivax marinus TaxID=1379903 RepID=UPI00273DCF1A|nr:metallophosphoesterase [Roseivivax marinus]
MDPIFAIGDIHGQRAEMERVLGLIARDPEAGAPVVFLGDYVDRGPDSRGVLQVLIDGQAAGRPWIALAGNHDIYFRDFLDPEGLSWADARRWLSDSVGGKETLASYGVATHGRPLADIRAEARAAVPQAHRSFLAGLPLLHETAAQIFVHAGVRPDVPVAEQEPDDLVHIRAAFLDDRRDHGRFVVHGHTSAEGPVHRGNRANLDGGAGRGAPLCAALILNRDVFLLREGGRTPLI